MPSPVARYPALFCMNDGTGTLSGCETAAQELPLRRIDTERGGSLPNGPTRKATFSLRCPALFCMNDGTGTLSGCETAAQTPCTVANGLPHRSPCIAGSRTAAIKAPKGRNRTAFPEIPSIDRWTAKSHTALHKIPPATCVRPGESISFQKGFGLFADFFSPPVRIRDRDQCPGPGRVSASHPDSAAR